MQGFGLQPWETNSKMGNACSNNRTCRGCFFREDRTRKKQVHGTAVAVMIMLAKGT